MQGLLTEDFESIVHQFPEQVAIEEEQQTLSYKELNGRSNRLAHVLSEIAGVGRSSIVSVIMPSSSALVTALLATFKAGGIYLPLDLSFVKKRIEHIYTQTNCEVLLTVSALKEEVIRLVEELKLPVKYIFILETNGDITTTSASIRQQLSTIGDRTDNPDRVNVPDDDSYIFYTSGSTGEPKAILGTHRSLHHFMNWERREFQVNAGFRVTQLTQVTFDASLRDIFLPLTAAGVLCIPSAETKSNPAKLLNWVRESKANLIHCVPSLLRLLAKELATSGTFTTFPDLRHILVAGEILYARDIQNWRQFAGSDTEIVNLYGASETTLVRTFHRIKEVPENPAQVMHVGKPIDDTFIAILNAENKICRIGEIGEIYIKTLYATRGYYKNAALTRTVFIQNPLIKDREDRIYKTGDMGRYLPDRSVEVLGRLDDQVKVNGIRVELDEVKSAVLLFEDIEDVYVTANKNAAYENELVCYYVGEVDEATLAGRLKEELNEYLIPSFFIRLPEFPLTLNGKIDKKALPKPDVLFISDADYEAVINETEAGLEAIFKDILGLGRIGRKVSFFKIGGSSLNAMQVISRVYRQWEVSLKIADVFAHPSIAELAVLIEHGRKGCYMKIPKIPQAEYYPLSHAQSRLWVLNKFEVESLTYNLSVAVRLQGKLHKDVLEIALQRLVDRHESLRTVFTEIAGMPYQKVLETSEAGFILGYEDGTQDVFDEERIQNWVGEQINRPFDLESGPLFRANLLQMAEEEYIFTYAMHHIVSDGWSMEIIVKELFQTYRALVEGDRSLREPITIQYKDYAAWQQQQLEAGTLQESRSYWLGRFEGEIPVLSLPTDHSRPVVKTYKGAELPFLLDPELSQYLKTFAKDADASVYMVLLAAVYTLLYRYTGQEDIIVGTPVAGRDHTDLEDQVGFYVNTLALRVQFKADDTFRLLLNKVREVTLEAFSYQSYPFDKMVEELSLTRDTSRSALFDVMVVLQNIHLSNAAKIGIEGLSIERFPLENQRSKFDLLFNFYEDGTDIGGMIQYNTDLFDSWRIENMVRHLIRLLEGIVSTPTACISEINYLSGSEQLQLLSGFNQTQAAYPENESLVSLFESRVTEDPDAVALVFEGAEWSYQQVHEQSNALATYLRTACKLKDNEVVGLLLDRSEWMVIALLGILKAGAAYLPIDPAYPIERQQYMLEDSGASVLITDPYARPGFKLPKQIKLIRPGDLSGTTEGAYSRATVTPQSMAYVIYTSGSTGKPKGVMVPHRGVVNRISWMAETYDFRPSEAVLQKTPYVFDVSVWEFFMPLCFGGRLILCRKEQVYDPDAIINLVAAESVAHIHFVPSMFAVFLRTLNSEKADKLHALRNIYCSGEALPAELVRQHHSLLSCSLHNLYGPTEASVDVSYYETNKEDVRIPIGKPIFNTQLYILDKYRQLVPVGVPGELYIGGIGLANGYLNKPELTADRFINNPLGTDRVYRSGDEARWLPDGNIEYLGRLDHQVKIRGYRIELGEIEHALLQHSAIREAIVLIKEDQAKTPNIAAYFVADQELGDRVLRDFLMKSLPEHMIPVYFNRLESIPLTGNGKVDRQNLPDPDTLIPEHGDSYEPPKSILEKQLAGIWKEVLGRSVIGVRDNFFEVGGHSLKATQLVYRIHESFNRKIELKDIFLHPTIRDLATLLEQTSEQDYLRIPAIADQEYYELSHAQRRLWVLDKLSPDPLAYSMPAAVKLKGGIDREALQQALKTLLERHESLRTIFVAVNEEPRQKIIPTEAFHFEMEYIDLQETNGSHLEAEPYIREIFDSPFDLEKGPLFKVRLLQLMEDEFVFVYVMHHIVSDAWSLEILIRDLLQLYRGFAEQEYVRLAPVPIQYKDYAAWQNEQIRSGAFEASERYWLQQFSGEVPMLDMTTDFPRPAVLSNVGRNLKFSLGKDLAAALKKCGEQEGASLYMVLLSGLYTLLYRYTGQEDLVIGTPIAGRVHKDLEQQIGFFVNTLALRGKFKGRDSWLELLRKSRDLTLDAFAHQEYPFDMLVDKLTLDRDTGRSPLFDVMISLEDARTGEALASGQKDIAVSDLNLESGISNFDLSFDFIETADDLVLKLQYNTDLFSPIRIERMLDHYKNILSEVARNPDTTLQDIQYLSSGEKQLLLDVFNDTRTLNPDQISIIDLFEEQVERKPEAPAVVFETREMTYRKLNLEVNKLAHYLLNEYGVEPEDRIGIMVNRSERMLIYVLAILKTGAAYVPLDPEYPEERIRYMIEESGLKLLLTDQDTESNFQVPLLNPKSDAAGICQASGNNPRIQISDQYSAYIIFTSGSTGMPKGVAVSHGNLLNIALGWREAYALDTFEVRLLQMASISFDVFCGDVCRALLNGGQMVIVPSGQRMDLEAVYTLIGKHRVNVLEATPALLVPLMDNIYEQGYDVSFMELLILGSDTCNADDFSRLFNNFGKQMRLLNSYGTTETTIDSSFFEKQVDEVLELGNVPIGKPMRNTRYYILDAYQQLLPLGNQGELYIGGAGVSKGYINQPQLTQERFLDDPFNPGGKMYRTGDWANWTETGNICFLGRGDQQIKLRGYRIELGEIDHAVCAFEGIYQALTLLKGSGDDQELVTYFTAGETIDTGNLRNHLNRLLPAYMVPSGLMGLDAFPLSSNGKIDKKALPDPGQLHVDRNSFIAPVTELEIRLSKIWEEVLNREQIGIQENFFEIGGHSLKATRVISKIHKILDIQVPLRMIFSHPTIQSLALAVDTAAKEKYLEIKALPVQEYYDLSHAQRRLWILRQLDEDKTAYNIPDVYTINGKLKIQALEQALNTLVARHESLRTVFVTVDEEPKQQVIPADKFTFHLEYEDLSGKSDAERRGQSFAASQAATYFDLEQGPLFRVSIARVSDERYLFTFTTHHIISDGWSMAVLIREMLILYQAALSDEALTLPELRLQYRDYAAWQQQQLLDEDNIHRRYWLDQFSDSVPVLEMQTSYPRPMVKTYKGKTLSTYLDKAGYAALQALSRRQGTTLFMSLLSSVKALLYRYTGQKDIVLGTPIAGRNHIDLEQQVGFFVNTLALRTRLEASDSFENLLDKIKEVTLKAYEHQIYPFDRLVDDLNLSRDMSRSPLFDIMVVLQNTGEEEISTEGLRDIEVKGYALETGISKFDLSFNFMETDRGLRLDLEYSTDLFSETFIERMMQHWCNFTRVVAAHPEKALHEVKYMEPRELEQILYEFNDTIVPYSQRETIHSLFEKQVLESPDQVALRLEGMEISYSGLNEKANRIARYLIDSGVRTGDNIGIICDRTFDMVAGLYAIMKAGAAYVPIDPVYPEDRQLYIMQNSAVIAVLVDKEYPVVSHTKGDIRYYFLNDPAIEKFEDTDPVIEKSPEELAYTIYTSGSTGRPKGVMISHNSAVNLIEWVNKTYTIGDRDRMLFITSICFDLSVYDLFGILAAGGTVVIARQEEVTDVERLLQLLSEERITFWDSVPTTMNYLIQEIEETDAGFRQTALRLVFMSGDWIPVSLPQQIKQYFPNVQVVSLGGATEGTVWSNFYPIMADMSRRLSVPYGKPLSNNFFYILDEYGNPVPQGVMGELYIGGIGVAQGYANDPEKTAYSYVPNPFETRLGGRMYRTGDLGRMLEDWNMEFMGRKDHQVKIRGFRVELGEIKNILLQHESIKEVLVIAEEKERNEKYLVTYFVSEGTCNITILKDYLAQHLPEYMVPAYFVQLEAFPLTSNGKIDYKALPKPDLQAGYVTGRYQAPETETEQTLAGIWQDVLQLDQVGISDNFFDLGGHSLVAAKVVSRVAKHLRVKISMKDIFLNPYIDTLSKVIERADPVSLTDIKPVTEQAYYELSHAQNRLWIQEQYRDKTAAYNIPLALKLEGTIDLNILTKVFYLLLERHEILRTVFTTVEGLPRQKILTARDYPLTVVHQNLATVSERDLHNLITLETKPDFDLSEGPLWQVQLLRRSETQVILLVNMHHIISDGWSVELLIREAWICYKQLLKSETPQLASLKLQYKDYAAWHNGQLSGGQLTLHQRYWHRKLQGPLPVLKFPTDNPRPENKTYVGTEFSFEIPSKTTLQLRKTGRHHGASLYMTLLAGVKALLWQFTKQEDLIVGSIHAGRSHPDLEEQIGFYVNTLALRTRLQAGDTFPQLLNKVKETVLGAYEHQVYPFDRLVTELDYKKDKSRSPLFDIYVDMMNVNGLQFQDESGDAIQVSDWPLESNSSKYDLSFRFLDTGDALQAIIEFNTDLFLEKTIRSLSKVLLNTLEQLAGNPEMRIESLIPEATSEEQDTSWKEKSFDFSF